MNFTIGTEPTSSFYSFELAAATHKLLNDIMLLRRGEELVVSIDTAGDWRVAQSLAEQACILGAIPTLIRYGTQPAAQMEPPKPLGLAIQGADVWIDLSVQYILYTEARRKATELGCRHACLAGMDVDAMVRTIGQVDYPKLIALGDEIVRLLNSSNTIQVTCNRGTYLTADLDKNAIQPGGIATERGALIMLGGQVGCLPKEETIEGRIVIDGSIWPPDDIGVLQGEETVTLIIKKGSIVAVEGGSAAKVYRNWLGKFGDSNLYRMAHYVFGFNPGVPRLTGHIAEDERYFGSMTFGFGAMADRIAATHTDCIVLFPSVSLDGIEIQKNGKYMHPSLYDLCKSLGVRGYQT
ncbi:MAG: hypothetical protein A2X25_02360 [Chloroflexi bacterium GWB2_49_20]|nr:MAG: hypothetical protein A2X25_02360 [Chloroflexi bacterium GWB2_49_20]OGN79698.1 MAG: hypothetical protein A2X26_07340 [Chloroflexi bacterium GWC2_49_37]OGN85946.1 MAG: hypothetical protein A2X27_00100 [Chloroflexi bacterium GWD2_49_16]HBG73995.1 hypothetical protein [Anaerolineae bacterium]HCC78739.1 hypothetical protein [Anaerolineae bacterium]